MNRMEPSQNRLKTSINNLLFHLLLLVTVGLCGWLSQRHSMAWDWTLAAHNTLSETSRTVLERLEAPLQITSFAPESPKLRRQITEIIDRYRRLRPDITFDFINPDTRPELTRKLGIQVSGELRLEYKGRSENLRTINEESLSNAIQRLLQQGERWVAFIHGHGERRLDGQANHDLGQFGEELKRKGYRLQPLELAGTLNIPHNTALLVIAGPQVNYLEGETQRINRYLEQGGNLLWLTDPGGLHGLEPLAATIGLRIVPGTIVDANAATLGLESPTVAVIPRYPNHPATRGFELVSVFPHATALDTEERTGWQTTPVLTTLPRSWNEISPLEGEITRNPELGEKAGPLQIGISFTREQPEKEQRLLVIGDSDFLSNRYLGSGGNLNLGLNLLRWLSGDEGLLQIPARTAPDRQLQLSTTAGAIIGIGFLFLLPLFLFGSGSIIWWRRRKR